MKAILIFAIHIAISFPTYAQLDGSDILNVKPQDYRYLWYGKFVNEFDSAKVECTYGEFSRITPTDTVRINLRITETEWKSSRQTPYYQGSTTTGRDGTLEDKIVTNDFVVPPTGGSVRFYRMMSAENTLPCEVARQAESGSPKPNDWREVELSYAPQQVHLELRIT